MLTRRPGGDGQPHRHVDLREPPPDDLLAGLDAVVHLAADTGTGGVPADREIAFARALADQARKRRIPLLFVSSQAASPEAPSGYGKTKAAIEQAILPAGAIVLRPGLVYGGEERGLFGMLTGLLRRFPVAPRLAPSPVVQPIHVEDLAAAILGALQQVTAHGQVLEVAGEPVSFGYFLAMVARHRVRRGVLFLPVPVPLLRLALAAGGRLFGPRAGVERLDSLTCLRIMDARGSMEHLGIVPRDLGDGLSPCGGPRRRLLQEGKALALSLISPATVPRSLLRRYVSALSRLGHPRALGLPPMLLRYPALLAALDRPGSRKQAVLPGLAARMEIAYRLCESEPALASLFIRRTDGRLQALADIARASMGELRGWILAPLARVLLRTGQ